MEQIEALIQNGYFKSYVGKSERCAPTKTNKEPKQDRSGTPPHWVDRPSVINTIFSGPNGGQLGNKRKALAREAWHEIYASYLSKSTCPISFSDDDLQSMHHPHNDALL